MDRCSKSISLVLIGSTLMLPLHGCGRPAPDPEPDPWGGGEEDNQDPSTWGDPALAGNGAAPAQSATTHHTYVGPRRGPVFVPVPIPSGRSAPAYSAPPRPPSPPPKPPTSSGGSMAGTRSGGSTSSGTHSGATARGGFGSTGRSAGATS